tara:strand:- start:1960 stop:2127 length:168 start_codon:yes stop_codon:yes gene_type:complete
MGEDIFRRFGILTNRQYVSLFRHGFPDTTRSRVEIVGMSDKLPFATSAAGTRFAH